MSSKSEPPEEVWVKTEPDWDETSGELLTGRVQVKEEVVDLKEEAEWEGSVALYGTSKSALVDLYAGHEVKDELVLGPEGLQPADIVFRLHGNLKHEEMEKAGEQQSSVSRQVHSDTDEDVDVCEMPGVKHLKTADSTKVTIPYKCYSSAYKYDMVSRDRKLRGEKPYKCSHCSYTSARKDCLQVHYLRVHVSQHTGEKPYKCSHCSFTSAHEGYLRDHVRKHTGEKPYKCSHCSYTCARKDYLRVHVRKHTGVKPYKCSHCSYTSALKRNLLIHESKHTDMEPYKCSHCSYASARKRDLLTHESKHTGVKLYECSHCSFTSAYKPYLRVHERKHTGEKPYQCSHCSFTSADKGYLRVHVRKHAGEKPH